MFSVPGHFMLVSAVVFAPPAKVKLNMASLLKSQLGITVITTLSSFVLRLQLASIRWRTQDLGGLAHIKNSDETSDFCQLALPSAGHSFDAWQAFSHCLYHLTVKGR